MTNHRRWAGTVALAAAAVTALAACSSAASSTTATTAAAPSSPASTASSPASTTTGAASAATSPAAAAAGSPITVFVITDVNAPTGTFPGIPAAVDAAARGINAAGGINGHPVKVQACNGMADPNQEVTCARQAVASTAVAVVAPLLVANPAGDLQVLKAGSMADIAGLATSPNELASPIAFPLDSGSFLSDGCLQLVKAKLASKLAIVSSDISEIEANASLVAKSASALGVPVAASITLPPTAPDVTSQVQQVSNSGANEIFLNAAPNQAAQVLQASGELGQKTVFCASDGLLTAGQLTTLGPAAGSVYLAATMPPLSAAGTNPAVAHFISDMKAEQAAGDAAAALTPATYSSTAMRAWAGMQAFAQIAKTISGPLTKASFLAAIRKATDVTTGIFPPINFTRPAGGAQFPSLYNPEVRLLKWDVSSKEFVTTTIADMNVSSLAR